MWSRTLIALLALSATACGTYRTPGAAAPLQALSATVTSAAEPPLPSARFPARLAVVQVQAAGYASSTAKALGGGAYSVLTAALLLSPEAIARWPEVSAAVAVDAAFIEPKAQSLDTLRLAAAKQQADVLLAYTLDTVFELAGQPTPPGSKLALGDKPAAQDRIRSTARAVFVDVRSGFVYGAAEATASASGLDAHWDKPEHIDAQRLAAEQQAGQQLLAQAARRWTEIVAAHR